MSEHEPLVINYIANDFKENGLTPGGENGSWFQEVKLISTQSRSKNASLTIKGKKGKMTIKEYDDYVIWTNQNVSSIDLKNLEYVFCGFGINAPEYQWNDFEGIDVKGKVIVCLVGDPGFYNPDLFRGKNVTYYSRYTYKFEEAKRQGAAGCLVIHSAPAASYGWQVVQTGGEIRQDICNSQMNMDDVAFKGWVRESVGNSLLELCGYNPETVIADAKKPGFKAFSLKAKGDVQLDVKAEIGLSHNVIGILPGTDKKDEYIIYTAHWDHLGVGKPIDGDNIYNGAEDNASGTAGLLLLAKRFAESNVEHRRTIIFAALTAEESGLLGGQHYCENPIYPLEKTAVNINIDGLAPRSATHDISVRGYGLCDVDKYLEAAAAAQGRTLKPVLVDAAAIFFRCDHFNFVKKGVPALFAGCGGDFVDKEGRSKLPWENTYHLPNDEYRDWWPIEGGFQDLNLFHSVGLMISNADEMPKWNSNSSFQR